MKDSENGQQKLFSHPITLKLFLYGLKSNDSISIRQAQRHLGITSSSSVHWHLNKLLDVGLMEQHPDNSYSISNEGKQLQSIVIPVKTNFLLFNGIMIPSQFFSFIFLITSLIFSIILLLIGGPVALIFLFLTLLVQLILISRDLLKNWKEYTQEYQNIPN